MTNKSRIFSAICKSIIIFFKKMCTLMENICKQFNKAFCCVVCCFKHERQVHTSASSETIHSCALCTGNNLQLESFLPPELLHHIATTHQPLYCDKCNAIFITARDLEEKTGCLNMCNIQQIKLELPESICDESDETMTPGSKQKLLESDASSSAYQKRIYHSSYK